MGKVNIEIKEDSPEKLAAVAGKPTKQYLFANEFNELVEATNDSDDKITVLQGLQNLRTNFTGQAYAVWTGVGLVYDVIYPDYYLAGVSYPGTTEQITLEPSDAEFDRKDVIVVGAAGAYAKTGDPEAVPIAKTVDPNTEIYITTADIPAGATEPANTSEESVYKENAEWTATGNTGTVIFNATATPFQGVKHIDCGAFTNNQYLQFLDSATNEITDFDLISFRVNLKSTFANNTYFTVQFFNGGTLIGYKAIPSGSYNFVRTLVNSYQQVIVPLNELTLSSSTFDRIRIVMSGNNTGGFRMDNIILSKGASVASPLQNAITSIVTDSGIATATTNDDTFTFKGLANVVVSALGKVVSFAVDLTNYYTKAEIDSKISSLYRFKGNVADYASLPSTGLTVGDVYNLSDTGANYAWTGTVWDKLGDTVDISGKEDISNKSQDIETDKTSTTKYSSVKQLYDWAVAKFQSILVSGTNIKTINGNSILGSGNLTITTGVTRTLKTITSANLSTQDAAGFVAYINALGVVLVVGANEIVEYQLSDTGRVFNILLNGRSFGVGQPAITTANVEEITLWMSKDVKLSNYASTRNDGQLPTNKVLAPDTNGNLKLYTIATAPAPYMELLIPDSTLPSTTTNFTIKGAFFTPTMTVTVVGQTVNYVTFVSDNLIRVNITTSVTEGSYDVTLNNGLSSTFPRALLIVLGTVYTPLESEWTNLLSTPDISTEGRLSNLNSSTIQGADWKTIPAGQNFRIMMTAQRSGFATTYDSATYQGNMQLIGVSDGLLKLNSGFRCWGPNTSNGGNARTWMYSPNEDSGDALSTVAYGDPYKKTITLERIGTTIKHYVNGTLIKTFTGTISVDVKIRFKIKNQDISDIKYIEIA